MRLNKIKAILMLATMACSYATSLAQIPSGYYNSLKGKKGKELKNAVHEVIKDAEVLSYGSGAGHTWWGFWTTDRTDDGRFIDRYSPETTWVQSTSQGESGTGMNIEHSFPKSWWGGTTNQAYQDLYNLMPCEQKINSSKSNYPMGKVATVKTTNGMTKIGTGTEGFVVWEPGDEWKGDFARGYMYMATCYQNLTFSNNVAQEILTTGDYPTLKPWAYTLYIEWAKDDQVSQLEIARNNAVSEIQGNRNPFVDFPNLMDYIWGDSVDYDFDPATTECTSTYDNNGDEPYIQDETIADWTFTTSDGAFTTENAVNPLSKEVWTRSTSYGWVGSAYQNSVTYAADASLVSKEIDLTEYSSATLNFSHACNKGVLTPQETYSVEVRCNGETTVLSGITWPKGTSWTFNDSGKLSLNDFAGKKIQIVFHYTSTDTSAGTWEIKSATIKGKKQSTGIKHANAETNKIDWNKSIDTYSFDGSLCNARNTKSVIIVKQGKNTIKISK